MHLPLKQSINSHSTSITYQLILRSKHTPLKVAGAYTGANFSPRNPDPMEEGLLELLL
jgi:hypothetical protein